MKTILVPCDFSKPAINAFRFAVEVAAKANGTIHLLHVVELPVLHDSLLMPVLSFEEQHLIEVKEKTENQFEEIIKKHSVPNVKVIHEVETGPASKTILEYIEENSIDLVIMGSHGTSGLREFFVGSNAEKIVRSSTVPVLVVKNQHKGPVKDIIFPNTLQLENQEDLVMKVKALQHFFEAKLHLVWINTPLNFTSDAITRERLNRFAKRFMLKDYTINIYNHYNEDEGISQFTHMINGDMIAMGTHGRKGVSHLLLGSLAEDVVNHTESLIWTYAMKNEPVEA